MKAKIKDIVKNLLIKEGVFTGEIEDESYDELSTGVDDMKDELEAEKKELEAQRDATKRTQGINQYEDPEINSKNKQFQAAKLDGLNKKIKEKEGQQKKVDDLTGSIDDLRNSKVKQDADEPDQEQLGQLDALK